MGWASVKRWNSRRVGTIPEVGGKGSTVKTTVEASTGPRWAAGRSVGTPARLEAIKLRQHSRRRIPQAPAGHSGVSVGHVFIVASVDRVPAP